MEKEFDIEKIIPNNLRTYVSEKRENGMFLSDYQIETLKKYGFSYQKYQTIKELLFDLETYLNSDDAIDDFDSLEQIVGELSEREYYSNTNQ